MIELPPKLWVPPKPAITRPAAPALLKPAPGIERASFLPGMFPAGAAGVAADVPGTIALFGSSTSTAASVTAPASIQAGDLLVLLDAAQTGTPTDPTVVLPSGFTSINELDGFGRRVVLSRKLAAGTEGGTSLTGMSATSVWKALLVFRRTPAASSVNHASVAGQIAAGSPANQNVTAASGAVPLVVIGAYTCQNPIGTRVFSPTEDGEISPATVMYLRYRIYNDSPSNTDVNVTDSGGDNGLQSCYIEMS